MTTQREKLLEIAAGLLNWMNIHPPNAEELTKYVSGDVVLTVPYPAQTPDFAGLIAHHKTASEAAPDLKITLLKAIVDENESTVVHFLEITGTHQGYNCIMNSKDGH